MTPRVWRELAVVCLALILLLGAFAIVESLTIEDMQADAILAQQTIALQSAHIDALDSEAATLTASAITLTQANLSLSAERDALTAEIAAHVCPTPYAASRAFTAPSPDTAAIQALIRTIAAQRGVDGEALVELARRESTWNANAVNGSCKGLFQLAGDYPDWADPVANTHNAITYIIGRYGSVEAALTHHDAKGWY